MSGVAAVERPRVAVLVGSFHEKSRLQRWAGYRGITLLAPQEMTCGMRFDRIYVLPLTGDEADSETYRAMYAERVSAIETCLRVGGELRHVSAFSEVEL